MKGFNLALVLVILILIGSSYFDTCNARRGKHWRQRRISASDVSKKKGKSGSCNQHHKGSCKSSHSHAPTLSPTPNAPVPPALAPAPSPAQAPPKLKQPGHGDDNLTTFNVMTFGAKGDGTTDDTKAFQAAWAAACKVRGSTIVVPFDYTYLVGPISFAGPYCQEDIVFQLDGTIIAPTEAKAWSSDLLWWIEFTKLKGIAMRGSGVIDGRGSVWWNDFPNDQDPISIELTTKMPRIKPTALRFYGSFDVRISGITIQNSPQCHLKFDNCEAVQVYNMSISSPANSINTDGIHLQNSRDVNIHSTNLACGDDCVSIQTGCTNVFIHNVNCGPGHGISIGGLGKDNTKACVSNITVRDVVMHNTMNGVRIKTWQGGSGSVQGITFSNIQVSEVQTPIVIDQFYCDKNTCSNQSSAVALSGIHYERIRGTYTVQPVHFACSDAYPCTDLTLTGIQLQPIEEHYHMYQPQCWQTFGELLTPAVPPIDCLQIGKPSNNNIESEGDSC